MGGIVTPSLVAAVSEAGGVGTVVGSGLGKTQMSIVLDRVETLTDRPYAVNFLIPFLQDTECIRLAARRARVVEMFYGMPDRELIEIIHDAGALCGWQVGSVEEASAAKAAGCDIITVQGVEGGGHIRGNESLHQLLRRTTADSSVPIVAAGGIGDRRPPPQHSERVPRLYEWGHASSPRPNPGHTTNTSTHWFGQRQKTQW
jgi:nitronate monooxygenase